MTLQRHLKNEKAHEKIEDRMHLTVFAAQQLQKRIDDEAETDACRDAVGQRHGCHDQKGGKSFFDVLPIDMTQAVHHEKSDDDQRRCSHRRKGRQHFGQRCEKQRQCHQ